MPKEKSFPKVMEAEWVQPIRKGYGMACCDCGLVHRLNFRLRSTTRGMFIQFQAFRDDKATRNLRRRMKRKGEL